MNRLEYEVALAQEQAQAMKDQIRASALTSHSIKSLLKPRDIALLELKHLQGLEDEGRLSVFLAQVEAASEVFEERRKIVITRVDPLLAMYLQTTFSSKEFENWNEFKDFLRSEFSDTNLDKAYACISKIKCDWVDDPQSFATEIKQKYAVTEAKFPSGSLPKMDKVIKKNYY